MTYLAMLAAYWRIAVAALVLAACAWGGWEWRDRSADAAIATMRADAERKMADAARAEAAVVRRAQKAERAIAADQDTADTEASARNDTIEQDYRRRLAGFGAERDRLQDRWATCETDRLAQGAGAAAAAAEQDRSRRDSAARIVRAAEIAQSERDEVIDRYEAVRRAVNAGP